MGCGIGTFVRFVLGRLVLVGFTIRLLFDCVKFNALGFENFGLLLWWFSCFWCLFGLFGLLWGRFLIILLLLTTLLGVRLGLVFWVWFFVFVKRFGAFGCLGSDLLVMLVWLVWYFCWCLGWTIRISWWFCCFWEFSLFGCLLNLVGFAFGFAFCLLERVFMVCISVFDVFLTWCLGFGCSVWGIRQNSWWFCCFLGSFAGYVLGLMILVLYLIFCMLDVGFVTFGVLSLLGFGDFVVLGFETWCLGWYKTNFPGICGFSGFFLGGCIGFVILVICSGFLAVKCGILLFWLFGFDVFW